MATSLTIEGLKKMRRWPLWQLEPKPTSKDPLAMTKTPKGISGFPIDVTDPDNLHTYAELEPYISVYSAVGLALGLFDGVYVGGVDIDKCH
jgi:primase-polymerase (primpol)-like protein